MNLRNWSIALSFVLLVVGGPAFAQRMIGGYSTADKATTGIDNASGSITLTYAAVPYKSGSTFVQMSEGKYPKQFMDSHRQQMRKMCQLTLKGTDLSLGECKLEPGTYAGGFDVADDGKWSLVFYQGEKEMFREPVDMKKGAEECPCLVLTLMRQVEPGCVGLGIHFGPNGNTLTLGANMMGTRASAPAAPAKPAAPAEKKPEAAGGATKAK